MIQRLVRIITNNVRSCFNADVDKIQHFRNVGQCSLGKSVPEYVGQ